MKLVFECDRSDRSLTLVALHRAGHSTMQTGLTGFFHRSDRLVQTEPCTMRSNVLFSALSSMIRILIAVMIILHNQKNVTNLIMVEMQNSGPTKPSRFGPGHCGHAHWA